MPSEIVVHLIAAARPNFMKVAPLYHELAATDWCRPVLVHTGQHYDANMSDTFFEDLRLPKPDFHLGVGSGTHAEQTAGVMVAYEKILMDTPPDWIVVVGDVNSTIACTLAAKKLCLSVAHLEAGLRSGDWAMPEEINRIVTDSIADVLWTPSVDGDENLTREGVAADRISFVGNIMIDSYELMRDQIEKAGTREALGLTASGYGVVTLHRPSNVDHPETLSRLIDTLVTVSTDLPLVFAMHPRTRKNIETHGYLKRLESAENIRVTEPMSYINFLSLVREAKMVLTDSGGIQEETTYLGIPCLTLRDTTERPITVTQGSNRLVTPENLEEMIAKVVAGDWPTGRKPDLWDGRTAGRIAADIKRRTAKK
ncbi:MAG: UDP-N-acetylglucosamine 2-epimerase (non-hydrolyzing) [Rhodospirillaceae bacterium]|jgi:UDP-N-acetylglucosamine 2-epimerase (non-hydrolysing)|nr:UDP-N-acetylglucosamine 2-epimerase (non-hydrolyzing) [Rhodospirillaceae bacterium]MBT5458936.1 UDP-N-acetylglucosamine 2-epimerase (non-hydrolyzing) [Rhodospirillaceae bacterium]